MSNDIRCLIRQIAAACRIRHWHGHGVHSPTAYRFTREVFSRRRHLPRQGNLYKTLLEHGVDNSTASLVQATYLHFNCNSWHICGSTTQSIEDSVMYVLSPKYGTATAKLCASATATNKYSVICLLNPQYSHEWYNTCLSITQQHSSMSIDCRNMILLLNLHRINHEHIKL